MIVTFGEWLPDQPDLGNPGASVIKNAIPRAVAYGQFRGLETFSGALTTGTACFGSVWAKDTSGTIYNHAGTATTLEELGPTLSWSNVSKAGNYTGSTNWEWTKLGNRLIAVSEGITTQYFDLGSSSLYADLAGSPPKAKHAATVRNFVVLGNINDGADKPARLAWSGYNNSELWTPSRATQSDVRDLNGRGGAIQRIVPGQYGVIFQERSIWVMRYSGPPTIFSLDEVEKGRGTPAPNSVCYIGDTIFYLGWDGFYRFQGGRSEPIGAEKVDRWFFKNSSLADLSSVRGVIDPRNKLAIWAFKSSSSVTSFDRILMFNWSVNRWSYAEVDLQTLSDYLTAGLTLDDLDSILADIDTASISVDSDAYEGGGLALVAFDTSHKMATFNGSPLTAVLETKEIGESNRFMSTVRPLVTGGTSMISNGTRNLQSANAQWTGDKSVTAMGTANFRQQARFHRYRATISGGFENAIGVDVTPIQGGLR